MNYGYLLKCAGITLFIKFFCIFKNIFKNNVLRTITHIYLFIKIIIIKSSEMIICQGVMAEKFFSSNTHCSYLFFYHLKCIQ